MNNNYSGNSKLDILLARSAPPSTPNSPELGSAIAALADEARTAFTSLRKRPPRSPRFIAGISIAAITTLGAAAYGTSVVIDSGPWNNLTHEAESQATRFEWLNTLPDGTECVNRLTGLGLNQEQVATVESALSDPARLLQLDAGAVREEFLRSYDESPDQQEIADRETWTSWIDAGYAAVATMDVTIGRGEYSDDELTDSPGSAENEVFMHTFMRLVIDGITTQGVDAMRYLTPESACEVTP